jgi:Holliday junction resolvasome RuvABC ATP-dependent DNA helicase subunit
MFEELVGQVEVKRKLAFYASAYATSRTVPFLNFIGARGLGKTNFVRSFSKTLLNSKGQKKPLLEINSSSIKTSGQFFEQIFVDHVQDKEVILFFDECHCLPENLIFALLTILNTEKTHVKEYNHGSNTYTFDFTKINILFATTESDKLFLPFRDRLTTIEFADYSTEELEQIFVKNLPDIQIEKDALALLADTSRGNPRSCVLRAKDVGLYCKNYNVTNFTLDDANKLIYILGILPHGLNRIEWQILNILRQQGHSSLSALAAKTGLSRTAIQKDHELFLIKKNLIHIDGLRMITTNGVKVLNSQIN